MQSTLRNRNSALGNDAVVLPLCQEIREFVEESRRCQTLYANLDGQFPERTFSLQQQADIENYIKETALHADWSGDTDLLSKFASKICDLSSRFGMKDAKFFIIWVFFFNYNLRRMEITIFIKVFGNNETHYFGCDLQEYSSWDLCVMKCKLPSSFACFPRDGEYVFKDDKLDLEFVCKSAKSEEGWQFDSDLKLQPWYQRVLFPALGKVSEVISQNETFYKSVHLILSNLLPEIATSEIAFHILHWVIAGIWGLKTGNKIVEKCNELFCNYFKSSIKTNTHILLDKKIPDDCIDRFCLSPVKTSPKDMIVSHNDFSENFRKLLGNVKKNFLEIVKTVLRAIIHSGEEILILGEFLLNHDGFVTKDVKVVLNIVKAILNSVSPEEVGGYEANKTKHEVDEFLDEARNRNINTMLTRTQQDVTPIKTPLVTVTLQINCFGYEVNIFHSASILECTERLRLKLKSDVKLLERYFYYEIMKNDVIVGVLAFVAQSVAVAVFKDQCQ